MKGMTSLELQAVVSAWQSGAISQDTMLELFRKGEILPDGRSNQDEKKLVRAEVNPTRTGSPSQANQQAADAVNQNK